MNKLLLLPFLLIFPIQGLSAYQNKIANLREDKETTYPYTSQTHKVWCGDIGKFEKAQNRPSCEVKFKDDLLVIDDFLEISNSQLIDVQFNQVCLSAFMWETCVDWVRDRLSDKRYTITYKSVEGKELIAVLTARDHSPITGQPNKLFKTFKKDLEIWMGRPITNIGPLIRNIK